MAIVTSSLAFVGPRGYAATFNFPVSASQRLWAGQLVGVTSDGYLQPAADSASFLQVGVCSTDVDNSTGANGAVSAEVYQEGEIILKTTGTVTPGYRVYVKDDSTVAVSGSDAVNGVFVGVAHQNASTNKWWVQLGISKTGYGSML